MASFRLVDLRADIEYASSKALDDMTGGKRFGAVLNSISSRPRASAIVDVPMPGKRTGFTVCLYYPDDYKMCRLLHPILPAKHDHDHLEPFRPNTWSSNRVFSSEVL